MAAIDMHHSVRLRHRFDLPVYHVFDAWSDPAQLAVWAWGSLGRNCRAEVDFSAGGVFHVETVRPDGEVWSYSGTYTLIEPGARITHTVIWDAPMGYDRVPELLDVTFAADGTGSTIELLHTGLPTASSAEGHRRGWLNVLEALERMLASRTRSS